MGIVELQTQEKRRRAKIQQGLMLALYRATNYSSMAFAPTDVLLRRIDPQNADKGNPSRRIQQAMGRLRDRGLLEIAKGKKPILTKKGLTHAARLHAAEVVTIKKPKKWDGRWRIVIFDIWERRREVRDKLRRALAKSGFLRVQDSVWIYPYGCEEFIGFLRTDLKLGPGVLYIIAEGIEKDERFRKYFSLP